MRIIAVALQKGGVCKTTSTINLAAGLARHGKKVLAIDFDPQGSLSYGMGVKNPQFTIQHALLGDRLLQDIIIQKEGFDIAPADIKILSVPNRIPDGTIKQYALKYLLRKESYDYVLIDCPPNLEYFTITGLAAATEILMPVKTEYLTIKQIPDFLDTVQVISSEQGFNPGLKIRNVLIARHDSRRNSSKKYLNVITELFEGQMIPHIVSEAVDLDNAQSKGMSIFSYLPDSTSAQRYSQICEFIISQEQ